MEELLDGLFDPPDMTPEERFAPPSDDLKDMEPDNEPRPEGSIENNYPDLEIKPMPYMGEDFDKPEIIEASNKWEDHFSPTVLKGLQLAGTFTAAATDPALASVELESSGPEVSPDISVMKV